jgi:CheY-like chemotaxis protein
MFAEDNEAIRKVYEKNFLKEGYKVILVEHGARVLAELHEQKVDLLVTDLEMPGANTLEIFPILKEDFPKLPVIVVTGHYSNLKEDFLDKGFIVRAIFNKPISVGVLKEEVRKILRVDEPIAPKV